LQEVEAVADHVILVHEGRVIFDGTPQEMAAGRTLEQAFYELTGNLPAAAKTTAAKTTAAPPPDSTGTGVSAAEAVTQAAFPKSTGVSAAEAVTQAAFPKSTGVSAAEAETRAAFPKPEAKTSAPADGATNDLRDAGGAE
jgi:ABC-type multidrug transport system ATPase subunit